MRVKIVLGVLGMGCCASLYGESLSDSHPAVMLQESPLPNQPDAMRPEDLINLFEQQKKGSLLEVVLRDGSLIKGLFSSYDDFYGTLWLYPKGQGGFFKEKSYRIDSIKSARIIDKKSLQKTPSSPPSPDVNCPPGARSNVCTEN